MEFNTAIEKRDAIIKGDYSASENILLFLKTIEKTNPQINAIISVNEKAIEAAQVVDDKIKRKEKVGKLAGLGIVIKSNISVDGQNITCASKTLEDYKGTFDADVVRAIRDEDGIILGMANMDEFASGASGETSAYGRCDNPAAPGMIPGGSSSGSAASVAADMCDFSLGTDTGGSIRNPASHCGVVGIKPSYGRVSRYGLVDLAMSLDQIGTLANNVTDAGLLLSVIAGHSENDATTVDRGVETYNKFTKPQNIKIGICPELKSLCTDDRIWEMIEAKTRKVAAENNWEIKEISLPNVELAVQTYYPIVYVEFFSGTRKFDGRKYGKKIEDATGPEVLRRILGGQEISKAEYAGRYYRKALQAKAAIAESIERAFDQVDVIMLPAIPRLPHAFEDEITVDDMYGYDAFTTAANLAGICAGVVPAGKIDGIPVGLQIMAAAFAERMLFDVMKAAEE
jgi:aspartyl-tRNA(Asn)/glutamyl-tRNA(Gln) amidotransferase subunit A